MSSKVKLRSDLQSLRDSLLINKMRSGSVVKNSKNGKIGIVMEVLHDGKFSVCWKYDKDKEEHEQYMSAWHRVEDEPGKFGQKADCKLILY